MREMKDMNATGRRRLYPFMLNSGMIDASQLAQEIAHGCSFTVADVKGLISAMAEAIAVNVAAGKSVRIDGVGVFSASLGLADGAEAEEAGTETRRNARSVRLRSIRFRPDGRLVQRAADSMRLERADDTLLRTDMSTGLDERRARALAYLEEHVLMHLEDYVALTGMSRSQAQRELKALAADPDSGIGVAGRSTHRYYIRKPQP